LKPFEHTVNAQDIRDLLGETFAKWQLPDKIFFVDEIPKTSVGKYDKKVLRAEYQDIFMKQSASIRDTSKP
jgi:fatty-acyl-CoA synthase